MNKKERQAQRAQQEDVILVKVLWWIVSAGILEALLLLLNKVYVHYTVDQINMAYALRGVIQVLSLVLPVCAVVLIVWAVLARRSGRMVGISAGLAGIVLALAVCAVIVRVFDASGVRFLYVAVPAVAVLALIYYLYQRDFFFSAVLSALGLLAVKLVPRTVASPVLAYGYAVVLAVVVLAAALLFRRAQGNQGKLTLGGKLTRLLPKTANYPLLYVTCFLVLAVLAAVLVLGGLTLLYGVLAGWLLILAVYYTVRLM